MDDTEQPPPKKFVLKQKEIVPMDPPASARGSAAISVQEIHEENRRIEERKKALAAAGAKPPPEPQPEQPAGDAPIVVKKILLENHQAATEAGLEELVPGKRRSNRKLRDFLLGVGLPDIALGILAWKLHSNVVTVIFTLSGMVLITASGAWIIFFVMD